MRDGFTHVWIGFSCSDGTASLRFQPTKRPQIAAQKAKAKAIASKFSQPPSAGTATAPPTPSVDYGASMSALPSSGPPPSSGPKTTIADWTATASDDDINNIYAGEKRQRGGRKKRKKNREAEDAIQNWDDIYDPSRPNNYEEYKNSDEKIREVRDWKDILYAHRMKRQDTSNYDSEGDEIRPMNGKTCTLLSFCSCANAISRKICTTTVDVFCAASRPERSRFIYSPTATP